MTVLEPSGSYGPSVAPSAPVLSHGRRPSLAAFAWGAVLVWGGIAWLLHESGAADISLEMFAAVALVGVGGLLVAGSKWAHAGGAIAMGVMLVALLAAASASDIAPSVSAGDRTFAPTTLSQVESPYKLGAGNLVLDFSSLALPSETTTSIEATVGMGQVDISVPFGVTVRARTRAGMGDVKVFGQEESGIGVDKTVTAGSGTPALVIDASVGMGEVVVHRGG